MKPSWDDAPEWAQWLAMDSDGTWYWYDSAPLIEYASDNLWTPTGARYEEAYIPIEWRNSSECRP